MYYAFKCYFILLCTDTPACLTQSVPAKRHEIDKVRQVTKIIPPSTILSRNKSTRSRSKHERSVRSMPEWILRNARTTENHRYPVDEAGLSALLTRIYRMNATWQQMIDVLLV